MLLDLFSNLESKYRIIPYNLYVYQPLQYRLEGAANKSEYIDLVVLNLFNLHAIYILPELSILPEADMI